MHRQQQFAKQQQHEIEMLKWAALSVIWIDGVENKRTPPRRGRVAGAGASIHLRVIADVFLHGVDVEPRSHPHLVPL